MNQVKKKAREVVAAKHTASRTPTTPEEVAIDGSRAT